MMEQNNNTNIEVNNNKQSQNRKINIFACFMRPFIVSIIIFLFIFAIKYIYINVSGDDSPNFKFLNAVQISLPLLVDIFGPMILYAIEIN
jgi:hypothetical protein